MLLKEICDQRFNFFWDINQTKYTYDERGLRKTLDYLLNSQSVLSINYAYNERKLLSEMSAILGGQEVSWQRFWDELGRPETDIYSNGVKVQRSYDAAGRMTYLSNEYANGGPLSRFELSYNPTGTIKEILKSFIRPEQTTPGQYVLKYNYDDLDRLVYASTDGNFSYDVMGNHTNRGQVHNNLNQLLEDSEYTYEYTTNGQLSRKVSKMSGEKTEYLWNVEGKVTQTTVRRADNTIKAVVVNKYDAFERRIERSGVRYAYDGEDIVLEFSPNNTIQAIYLHGAGIDEPIAMARDLNQNGSFEEKELFFYSKDHLNSVHDLTDSEGKPVQRYNYTAYGKTKVEKLSPSQRLVQSPYGYTSREWEQESGDYYYRARNYDPNTGRFLSEDPLKSNSGDNNFYRYVLNNPIYANDPLGLYGSSDCTYYKQACEKSKGPYECGLAQKACEPNPFTDNNFGQCVRQCLQEQHKWRAKRENRCNSYDQGGPGFAGTRPSLDFYLDHATCFQGCAANPENPYNQFGPDLPDDNVRL